MPCIVNLRQGPFERTPSLRGQTWNDSAPRYVNGFFAREFWRVVEVQQKVHALAETTVDFSPMQAPASFNTRIGQTPNRRGPEGKGGAIVHPPTERMEQLRMQRVFVAFGMGIRCVPRTRLSG